MVMILRRSLDAQGADSVAGGFFDSELRPAETMSRGPTLFSCGVPENDRWRDLDGKGPLRTDAPHPGLWERLPGPDGALWPPGAAAAGAVTSLIRDLSLSDRPGPPSAPPSKRQCRPLSLCEEPPGGPASWRPLGSRVWTPVEKRRCLSGGSAPRAGPGPPPRRASLSLPSRAHGTHGDHSTHGGHGTHSGHGTHGGHGIHSGHGTHGGHAPASPCQAGLGAPGGQGGPAGGARPDRQRSLSCSHERLAFSEGRAPASPPQPARRPGGLARSRSQPCVLSDKKVGVKRRRPEEGPEPRPSLDLAKMAQNCQAFSSLSGLSSGTEDLGPRSPFALHAGHTRAWAALFSAAAAANAANAGPGGRTPAGPPLAAPCDGPACLEELCWEEAQGLAPDAGRAWRDRGAGSSPCSLDGELDIEQIENN